MSKPLEINESNFEQKVLKAKVPVLVDFYSVFCLPCHAMKPVLAELADDVGNRAKVCTVEISANARLFEEYAIRAVPTLIVFYRGTELYRMVGLKTKEDLREALAI